MESAETFLLLKDTVRITDFTDYLWVIEGDSGLQSAALPVEGALLSLCDGTITAADLHKAAEVMVGTTTSDRTPPTNIVAALLTKFSAAVDQLTTAEHQHLRYDPSDYLHPVNPTPGAPERLPLPVEMLFTLTNRCNLSCVYCFNSSGAAGPDELSTRQWLDLAAQADAIGVQKIHLSGGEPLMHPGFMDIISDLKQRDFLLEVATNGTMRYSNDLLQMLNGVRVDVSLDTVDAAIYERLTGRPLLGRALSNVERLVHAGASVAVKACVTSLNTTGIAQLYEVLAGIGVMDVSLASYTRSISGRGDEMLELSSQNIDELRRDYGRVVQTGLTSLSFGLSPVCWTEPVDITSCDGLATTMIVLPNGHVTACELITNTPEMCFGNVLDESIMSIWTGSRVTDFFDRKSHPQGDACGSCSFANSCRTGCFAEKLYRNASLYGPDPRCRISV